MARLRQLPHAVRSLGFTRFGQNLWKRINDDDLTTQAAAVAYAWLFALFPFFIFLITLCAYMPEAQKVNARNLIAGTVDHVLARDAAQTITANLNQVLDVPRRGLLSIGLLVTLWIASGGMRTTMWSLDTAYDAKRRRPFWVQWPLAILLTVVITVMIALVGVLLPVGTAVEAWMAAHHLVPTPVIWLFNVARFALAVLLVLAVLSVLYQYGTAVHHPVAFVSPGAVFTLVVWFALGIGFRFYVDHFGSYQKMYGALGGVTILLLFFYLDAFVLLLGAEINSQVDECCTVDGGRPAIDRTEVEPRPIV